MAHVLVVTSRRYNGHELWTSLGVLQHRGHTFDIVSTTYMIEDEVTGQKNTIRTTTNDVPKFVHDGLVFVSGNMDDTEKRWTDPICMGYSHDAASRNVPVAAICCSTPMVRNMCQGKRVSAFPLIRIRQMLLAGGAILSKASLSTDGKLVTAENQMITEMWITNFCDLLEDKPITYVLRESMFKMPTIPRKPIPELERLTNGSRSKDVPSK